MPNSKFKHLLSISAAINALKKGINDESFSVNLPEETTLLLLTHSALITGDFYIPENETEKTKFEEKELLDLLFLQASKAYNDDGNDISIPIYLKNVTIRPFSNPDSGANLAFLCVYSDQIVGVSFGEIQSL